MKRFYVAVLMSVGAAMAAERMWVPLGPFGGAAQAVVIDPAAPDRLLAAARQGLLYRSDDRGQSWRSLPFPRELSGVVQAMAATRTVPTAYYVAISGGGCGLYRSTDVGESWQAVKELCGREVFALAISNSDKDVVAAGARDGVFLSRDAGRSWGRISPVSNRELQPIMSLAIDPDNRTIYAGTPHLPWKTTDGGGAWRSIHEGMLDDSDVFSIEIDPRDSQRVLASACSGVYSSRDGGATWERLKGIPNSARRTYTIRMDPDDSSVIYAGTSRGLYRSLDSGAIWRQVSPIIVKSIAFDPRSTRRLYMATDDEGLVTSADGVESVAGINYGFLGRRLSALALGPENIFAAMLSAFGGSSLFRYSRTENRWLELEAPAGMPYISALGMAGPSMLFASTYNRILRTGEPAGQWTVASTPWGSARVQSMFVLDGTPKVILAATTSGVYRSEDLGENWEHITVASVKAEAIYAEPAPGTGLLVQTASGLFTSSDRGRTWMRAAMPSEPSAIYGMALGVGGLAFAATTHGLYRSSDGGRSWRLAKGELGAGTVRSVVVHPLLSRVYALQLDRVFESADRGATWYPVTAGGLERSNTYSLQIDPEVPDYLYALTRAKGIYVLRSAGARAQAD